MYRALNLLSYFLSAAMHLVQFCGAQLTGEIVSPGNRFVVTVSIANPTQQTISILKWNNIFDNSTQLPVSLAVQDDQGFETQVASTYVMRAGVTNADLFSLAPGQSYQKVLDLRQILQNLASGGTGLQLRKFTVTIPPSFQGIISTGHPGPIPVEAAAADLNGPLLQLGNYAMAGFKEITVASKPFPGLLDFPIYRPADIANPGPADGIQVHSSCAPPNTTNSDAIFDAGVYARSLSTAARDSANVLFPQFFPDSSRELVGSIGDAITKSVQGSGPHVDLYCTDVLNMCGDRNILGYSFAPSFLGNAYIVLCPAAVALGRAPEACSMPGGTQISASTSHVLFHLMLTLTNVLPTVISGSIYGSRACQQIVGNATYPGLTADPTKNADSYAQLAIAHWAYGLGGPPYTGSSCLPEDGAVPPNQKRENVNDDTNDDRLSPNDHSIPVPSKLLSKRQVDHYIDNPLATNLAKLEPCSGVELTLVQNALANARALAAYGRDSRDPALWKLYFNGDSNVLKQVRRNFDKVARWDPTKVNISLLCDAQRRSIFCQSPAFTANLIGIGDPKSLTPEEEAIVFCPPHFYRAASLECLSPGYTNPFMSDQAGGLMHELLHSRALMGQIILDGSPAGGLLFCYDYFCTSQYAHDRVLPDFPDKNRPEFVAKNYEFYAYAARAKRTDCTWTEYIGSRFGLRND